MAQRHWQQEISSSLTVANIQPPVKGCLPQQKLQAITTIKSQDENSTNHLLLHPRLIKSKHHLTLFCFFLNSWFSGPLLFLLLVPINVLLNSTIKYSHHQLHMPLFLKSFFACVGRKKHQWGKRGSFQTVSVPLSWEKTMFKVSVNYTLSEEYPSELPLLLYPMYILTPQLILNKEQIKVQSSKIICSIKDI